MCGFALVDSVKVQDVFSMCEILHWIALLVREESVTAVVGVLRMWGFLECSTNIYVGSSHLQDVLRKS